MKDIGKPVSFFISIFENFQRFILKRKNHSQFALLALNEYNVINMRI